MKIYFAGSIRGGRSKAEDYAKIVSFLSGFGQVLSEHVGRLDLLTSGEESKPDSYIFDRDIRWIEESDVLIAEVSEPSLGVGYEIAYAEKQGKPVLCLYQENSDKKLSAMLGGNKRIKIITYKDIDSLQSLIAKFLKELYI